MKIKVNIPGFGDRFCSSNVEYRLYKYKNGNFYTIRKKETRICHNEYGPATECEDGSFTYFINDKCHRLNDYAYYDKTTNNKQYFIIGKCLGYIKEDFIKKLANLLVPKN